MPPSAPRRQLLDGTDGSYFCASTSATAKRSSGLKSTPRPSSWARGAETECTIAGGASFSMTGGMWLQPYSSCHLTAHHPNSRHRAPPESFPLCRRPRDIF